MGKLWIIIDEQAGNGRIVVDKTQVAGILGVHVNTVTNNLSKLPYKKGRYTVYLAPEGLEKSFRGR